jgi:hypothetical protein
MKTPKTQASWLDNPQNLELFDRAIARAHRAAAAREATGVPCPSVMPAEAKAVFVEPAAASPSTSRSSLLRRWHENAASRSTDERDP